MRRRRVRRAWSWPVIPLPTLAVTAISAGPGGARRHAAGQRGHPDLRRCSPGSFRSAGPTTESTPPATGWFTAADKPLATGELPAGGHRRRDRRRRWSPTVAFSLAARLAGRADRAAHRGVRLGLQPRPEGDGLVVADLRGRLRPAAGDRHPRPARRRAGRPRGRSPPGRCSASRPTSPTCCPTSPTMRRPGSAACRIGSAPACQRRDRAAAAGRGEHGHRDRRRHPARGLALGGARGLRRRGADCARRRAGPSVQPAVLRRDGADRGGRRGAIRLRRRPAHLAVTTGRVLRRLAGLVGQLHRADDDRGQAGRRSRRDRRRWPARARAAAPRRG